MHGHFIHCLHCFFAPMGLEKKKKELATREVSMHVICYQV